MWKWVTSIIYLQSIANRLSDVFNDTTKVTKSHISTVNTPVWIVVSEEQHGAMDQSSSPLKCDKPIRSKDATSYKKKGEKSRSYSFIVGASCP